MCDACAGYRDFNAAASACSFDRGDDPAAGLAQAPGHAQHAVVDPARLRHQPVDTLAFQRDHLIVAIGQAGPRTLAALRGAAIGNQLTLTDLQHAAERLGVEPAKLAAFAQVEAAGEGFDDCQRPRLLFERHVFFKQLVKHQGEAEANRMAGLYPALCNTKRGGYQGGPAEWARLQTAMTLHRAAAIESASWGMFQVMGFHWPALGYASADDWLAAMQQSERHLVLRLALP